MGVSISKSNKSSPQQTQQSAAPKGPAFFIKGEATVTALAQEDKRIQVRQEQRNKLFRFWIEKGAKGEISFIDGDLDAKGLLDVNMFPEHQLFLNGNWFNWFVCVAGEEPCPICESGDDASLVSVLTIIDHTPYTSKKNETFVNTRKLFVAKRGTHKLLQAEATKRGGLAGCRFDVARLADNAPNVGDSFSFTSKLPIKELQQTYTKKDNDGKLHSIFVPADYSKEITYISAADLRTMGFGKGTPIGGEKPIGQQKAGQSVQDAMG